MLQSLLRERLCIMKQRIIIWRVLDQFMKCKRYETESMLSESTSLRADHLDNCSLFKVLKVEGI